MKKAKVILLTLLITFFSSNNTFTAYAFNPEGTMALTSDCYNEEGKIIINSYVYNSIADKTLNAEVNKIDWVIPKLTFVGMDGIHVIGTISYPNYNDQVIGDFYLQWVFTPEDSKYESKSGTFHFYLWPPDTDAQKGKIPDPSLAEEITTPSLTASTVQLNTMTTYDINLDNKVSGSSYSWTSSDTEVVEVNAKSGLLKAKKEGKATVICEITLPDQTKKQLTSEVVVGYDDNAPVMTETDIDLEPGDVFDINLENKVTKSKYRWVSSDRSIAKVNSANGKVTAVAPGTAYVTCTITTPENQVIVLRCDINVTE